jgi:hypothetical protein
VLGASEVSSLIQAILLSSMNHGDIVFWFDARVDGV